MSSVKPQTKGRGEGACGRSVRKRPQTNWKFKWVSSGPSKPSDNKPIPTAGSSEPSASGHINSKLYKSETLCRGTPMPVVVYSYVQKWNKAKGNHLRAEETCPRCKNRVQYFLAYACDSTFFVEHNKQYAFKCPICPNFNEISKELANSIMRDK